MSLPKRKRLNHALAAAALGWGMLFSSSPVSAQGPSGQQAPPQGQVANGRQQTGNELRPGERVLHITLPRTDLPIVELHSRVIELATKIKYVEDFNPDLLSVTAISANQLRLRAEKTGVTSVRLTDENGAVFSLEVFIEKDVRELQSNINRLFPGSAIEVIGVRDSIILRGWVTKPDQIPQIVQVAGTYSADVQNHITVGAGNLIQLSVKVMEVQRSKLEQYGFNFLQVGQNHYVGSTIGGIVPIAGATVTPGAAPIVSPSAAALGNPQIQLGVVGNSDSFQAFFDLLKQESLLRILATPTVTTTSGRPATIHSGGQFPLLVPQGIGTATINYKDFGVQMETVPIVLSRGRVQLDISASVSDRDFSNSVDVNGIRVPGITSRDVNTRVEMNFGETLMIGGLISTRSTISTNKVPFLGDIPVIGSVFSRKNMQRAETELVILVTPNLAGPMRPDQVPFHGPGENSDDPTAHELAFDGHVEVPRFSDQAGYGNRNYDPRCLPPGSGYPSTNQYPPSGSYGPVTTPGQTSDSYYPAPGPAYQFPASEPDAYSSEPMPTFADPSQSGASGSGVNPASYRSSTTTRGGIVPASGYRLNYPSESDRRQINTNSGASSKPNTLSPTRPTPRFVGS
ncbi:MAG: pilus assembly protein N-terminal domain-containing protein [Planctomycetaceae bacterium]